MADRRLTPFSGKVVHESIKHLYPEARVHQGTPRAISAPLANLRNGPQGALDRQLLWGDAVLCLDHDGESSFVMTLKDGYCGWVDSAALGNPFKPTHRIASPATHLYPAPRVQAPPICPLYLNSRIEVVQIEGGWAQTPAGYIPLGHLRAINDPALDPVAVAERLLESPYLWGGNSAAGVDCSGLVQLAFHACGIAVPADSDQQAAVGAAVPAATGYARNDLLFWKGHVALVVDGARLIHANGHTMSVAYEDLDHALARIAAEGGGPLTGHRRLRP